MRPRRIPGAAVALAVALAACGPSAPTASPTPSLAPSPTATPTAIDTPGPSGGPTDLSATYAAIAEQVEVIRGLRPTADVAPVVLDEAQLKANLTAEYDRSNPAATVERSQKVLIALGLLPEGSNLRKLVLDLQAGQVAGYYSPEEDRLFVVSRSGSLGALEKATYAHEFTHQLQDQRFKLDELGIDAADQSDRSLARLALVEGDATATQTTWMIQSLTPEELGQLLGQSLDPVALAALQRAPAILRETMLFPYVDGHGFVNGLLAGGYDAVNAAFADPPDSTEQILHPEKYESMEDPTAITLPTTLAGRLGSGWSSTAQDTLGELTLRIWLEEGGLEATAAADAAAGWGGDRLALLEGPNGGVALAFQSAWDSAADATEFAAAARSALAGLSIQGTVVHTAGSTRVSIAIGENVAALAAGLPG